MIVAIEAGSKFHGFTGASLDVLVAAFAAAALWLVVFAIRWTASFPKLAPPGPETSDLGPEPPAVANFLVNRCEVTRLAVGATLVDLAARRVIGIEEVAADQFVVRLRDEPADSGDLTRYDASPGTSAKFSIWFTTRATGGSAPVQALEIGSAAESSRWWQRFAKAVERDARDRGLARNRWSRADWAILAGGLALVLGLFALAFGIAHLGEGLTNSRSGGRQGRWDWFYVAAFAELLALVALKSLRGVRDTATGRAAGGRWLGVRRFLRHDGGFADLPPAAVAIWQRYLSYGIALGVARAAAHALPFGDEDPRAAWSRYGGNWHQVRVEYPSKFGYGKSPFGVLLGGIVRSAFWGAIAFAVLPFLVSVAWKAQNDALGHENSGAAIGFVALFVVIFGVIGIYLLAQLIDGLIRVGRGALDLGHSRETRGAIIRIGQDAPYSGFVAIDDGHSAETKAFFPPAERCRVASRRRDHRHAHAASPARDALAGCQRLAAARADRDNSGLCVPAGQHDHVEAPECTERPRCERGDRDRRLRAAARRGAERRRASRGLGACLLGRWPRPGGRDGDARGLGRLAHGDGNARAPRSDDGRARRRLRR